MRCEKIARRNPVSAAGIAIMRGMIHFYRYMISPWLGAKCRFEPSCSTYSLQALELHGAWRGGGLALRRICRCHPWGGMGYDPVPKADDKPQ